MLRSTVWSIVVFLGFFPSLLQAQFYMPVKNDMQDTGQLWWFGTMTGQNFTWSTVEINRKALRWVQFYGDDPFYLVVRIQGVDFHAGRWPLREMIGNDPNATLELGGVFASEMNYALVWNSVLQRWEQRVVGVQRRIAVNIDVIANGKIMRIQGLPVR